MEKKNEFKFSTLRQFGSENVSFTATVLSENQVLSQEEIENQIKQIDSVVTNAFKAVQEREINEKELLANASERRTAAVKKLDDALQVEMKAKSEAQKTMKSAEKLSDKITKA